MIEKKGPFLLTELVELCGGELHHAENSRFDKTMQISDVSPLSKAGLTDLSFLTNPKYASQLKETSAGVVLLGKKVEDYKGIQWIHKNPYAAMAEVALKIYELKHRAPTSVEGVFIHPDADVHESAVVYPFAYIEKGATVAEGAVLYPHVFVGENAKIGKNSVLYANVSVMFECVVGDRCVLHSGCVIGSDGFGFAPSRSGNIKIPQIARAVLEDDVELQAGCTIDRGAFNDTIIREGVKMDDQVLIAHGVEVGKHSLIAGQGAIAGSTIVGERFIMAGAGAVGPSLKITDNVIVGPKSGVTSSVKEPGEYIGYPLVKGNQWRRQVIVEQKLPEILKTVRQLEKRVLELETKK